MAALDENITFLQEAKEAQDALTKLKAAAEEQELSARKLEKSLASEQKAVADSIELTVKKRRNELEKGFNDEIGKTASQLKTVQDKRSKAKDAEVKARIANETADTKDRGKQLKAQVKQLFKANGVPAYCNSTLFYALSSPRSFAEILLMIVVFLICFAAIPIGLYVLFGQGRTLWLIVIYLADIIVFALLYILLVNRVKIKSNDVLTYGHELRRQIKANAKQVDAITKGIRKDKNEDMYDLAEFDAEIGRLTAEKSAIEQQKKQALEEFDSVGRNQIADEINASNRERLEQLETETRTAVSRAAELQTSLKSQTLEITQRFEPMIGKDFMQSDKLEAISRYIESGQAGNINDAQELYRLGTPVEKVTSEDFAAAPPAAEADPETPED